MRVRGPTAGGRDAAELAGNHQPQQVAWLAHELQHALEVAAATEVRDVEGLRRLFARIGTDLGNGQFETDAAVAVGKPALLEACR